jgi:large subunit ribosomal protein L9
VNVKVILQTDVAGLGEEGEVKEVAGGYARNYLLPRKLAVPATKGNLKIREQQHEQIAHKQEQRRAEARELAERLAGLHLQFAVRVGTQGRLYGSVTAQDIAERVKSVAGLEVDRRSIDLKEPLRALGDFDVPVRVAHAVTAHLKVTLRDQNAPVVEPPAAPSPTGDAAAEATGSEPQGASTGSSTTSSA